MYFGYGWPKSLAVGAERSGDCLFLFLDHRCCIVVTELSVQIWSGGQYRVLLGQTKLAKQDVQSMGKHTAAAWSPAKNMLAVLVGEMQPLLFLVAHAD